MYCTVLSAAVDGMEVHPIHVEVDLSNGLPMFYMVGYLANEVKEARERVRTAIRNSGIQMPASKVTVNLSPADIRKKGAGFDLPIAAALLSALEIVPQKYLNGVMVIGELGLNGQVKPVPGVLPIVLKAKELGCKACIVPKANAKEGAIVQQIQVIGVSSIIEIIEYLNQKKKIAPEVIDVKQIFQGSAENPELDFADIAGQQAVKRAAEIAAAGYHHMLIIGPPGGGKTMIAQRIPTILPPLSLEESLEISKIYSITGGLTEAQPLIVKRPFHSPHHSVTANALIGGGKYPQMGLVSKSHLGLLFLDEISIMDGAVLDMLRQPLEDQEVHISRSMGSYKFPAAFLLVGAMNPCKCGYYPDLNKCSCSHQTMAQYIGRISSPFLDRLDLCIEAAPVTFDELAGNGKAEKSAVIRTRVEKAHKIQRKRYRQEPVKYNGQLKTAQIKKYCSLKRPEQVFMEEVFEKLEISARSYHNILKTARTIADLAGNEFITAEHLSEALFYRMADKKFWIKRI